MKTLQNITNGIESLIQLGVRRKDHLIAVGGGATTDFVGFLASIYMRGISYINIPTTLVGQVDAAIGSKTAVNFGGSKNIIGSFHHPKAVFIDENFLVKLPKKEISNGLAECIKTGIIASQELFEFIEDNVDSIFQRDPAVLKELVRTTVAAKLRLLAHDPLESTLSRSLNFGHTVGHAIELEDSLSLSHGEAISIGMLASVKVAKARGILHSNDAQRIVNLLRGCGLPENALSLHRKRFEDCIERIRMIRDGKLRFVMPVEIGEVIIVDDISSEELFNASVSSW